MALEAGSVYARLGWRRGDADQLAEWKRDRAKAEQDARKKVEQNLGFKVDERDLERFKRESEKLRRDTLRPITQKVKVDYDERGARQAEASLEKLGGAFRNLFKQSALITAGGLGVQAMSAASAGATALTSALSPLAGAMGAMPALGSAAAQGMGTLKLATAGLGDGMKAASEGGKAWEDALKKLTPQQAEFIRSIKPVIDHVKGLQATAREGFLPGAERGILAANRNFGVLRDGVGRTSRVMGELADNAGKLVGSKGFGRDLDTQMRRNDTTIRRAGEGGLNLANALRDVTIAAGPLVEWMTRMGVKLTESIEKQAHAGRESGKLAHFFDETRIAISRVARIGGDLATAFWNIGKAGKPLGDDILVNLVKSADTFRKWTDSARGENAIKKWFDDAGPAVDEVGKLIRDVGGAFFRLGRGDQVGPLIRKVRTELLPAFEDLIDSTTKSFGPVFIDALKEGIRLFTRISGSSGPLVEFTRLLGKVLGGINKIIDRVPVIGTALSGAIAAGGIYGALRIAATLSGLTRVIGLLRTARGVAVGTAAAEGVAGAAGAAGGAAAGGGLLARLLGGGGIKGVAKAAGKAGGVAAAIDFAINLKDSKGNPIAAAVNTAHDLTFGIVPKIDAQAGAKSNLSAFQKQIQGLASQGNVKGLQDIRKELDRYSKFDAPGGIRKAKSDLDKLISTTKDDWARRWGGTLKSVNSDTAKTFTTMRSTTEGRLTDIRKAVSTNVGVIKQRLGKDTEEGKNALALNFRRAARAVKTSMEDGKVSTEAGTREIRRLLRRSLTLLGFTGEQAERRLGAGLRHGQVDQSEDQRQPGQGLAPRARGGRIRRAIGGWIGGRGMVSDDVVPIGDNALAAYGEYLAVGGDGRKAVLNRYQAPVADMALAAGGYRTLDQGADLSTIERALLPLGGLDRLFAAITRPHYLAAGGIVPVPGFPGESAASSVIPMILQIARRFGLTLTDAYGKGHKSPGHTIYGTAADFAGPDRSMDAAVRSLVGAGYLVGYDGRFGSADWPGHGPAAGQGGANAHLHVELGGKGGAPGGIAASVAVPRIRPPQMRGAGAIPALVNQGLGIVAQGANTMIQRRAESMLAMPVGGGGGGGLTSAGGQYTKAMLAALWRRAGGPGSVANLMAAIALAESGGNPAAHNPSGATGLWQILGNPFPGNAYDPFTNARMAVSKYRSQGLGAWEAYTRGMHKRFLGAGGFLQRFAAGGRKRKHPIVAPRGKVTHAAQPKSLATARLANVQTTRIAEYDSLVGDVDDLEKAYSQQERVYNLTDDVLVDPDTGQVNQDAIVARAREIDGLINIRNRIQDAQEKMRRIAVTVVKTFKTIIGRLRASLRYTSRKGKGPKQREGIRGQIEQYEGDLKTYQANLHELRVSDIPDTRLDITELMSERAAVFGTTPSESNAPDADTGGGGDVGAADTAEPAAAAPTKLEIAQGVAAEFAAGMAARRDLLTSFGANAVTQRQAFAAGGVFSRHPDELTALAGVRGFGGTGDLSGSLGPGRSGAYVENLHVHYQQTVTDPATHVAQLRNIVENGVGG